MLYSVNLARAGLKPLTLVVIGTDCIGSYKSNDYTITSTMAPCNYQRKLTTKNIFDILVIEETDSPAATNLNLNFGV